MYSFRPMQAPSSSGSSELTIIFLFVLFLLIVSSTAAGIYFYTREETNCNNIEKSYDCKFNDNCKWNEDDSECEYDTDTDSDSDTDSDTDSDPAPAPAPLPQTADEAEAAAVAADPDKATYGFFYEGSSDTAFTHTWVVKHYDAANIFQTYNLLKDGEFSAGRQINVGKEAGSSTEGHFGNTNGEVEEGATWTIVRQNNPYVFASFTG